VGPMSTFDQLRALMKRFGSTVSRELQTYYLARPDGAGGDRIASAITLDLTAHHVVLSPIGNGKTTELIRAESRLRADLSRRLAVYVDPTELYGSGSYVRPGWLRGVCARALGLSALEAGLPMSDRGRLAAKGLTDPHLADGMNDQDVDRYIAILRSEIDRPMVVLVDSLDRLSNLARFDELMRADLPWLAQHRVGLVVTAPHGLLYGAWRDLLMSFSRTHYLPPVQTADASDHAWFGKLLELRDPDGLIGAEAKDLMIQQSGGLLRTLMALGQGAIAEAFQEGASVVSAAHVERACAQYSISMVRLGERSQSILSAIAQGRPLPGVEADWSQLVAEGLVLEDPVDPRKRRVHPLIAPTFAREAA
jgi:hypothetical protein